MAVEKPVNRLEHDILRELIAEWREEAGLSQRELSQKLGRPHNYIVKIETGQRGVEVINLIDILRVLRRDARASLIEFCLRLEKTEQKQRLKDV